MRRQAAARPLIGGRRLLDSLLRGQNLRATSAAAAPGRERTSADKSALWSEVPFAAAPFAKMWLPKALPALLALLVLLACAQVSAGADANGEKFKVAKVPDASVTDKVLLLVKRSEKKR